MKTWTERNRKYKKPNGFIGKRGVSCHLSIYKAQGGMNMESKRIDLVKEAIEKLNAVRELVDDAYKALIKSGLSAREARTVCRCYTDLTGQDAGGTKNKEES